MKKHVIPIPDDTGEAGFTLVELLVSLALMALMSAYAVASLRTFSAMERVSKTFEQQAEVYAAQRNLRQLIGDARLVYRTDDNGLPKALFDGKSDAIRVLSTLNDRLERGGLYVLDFTFDEENHRLQLKSQLFRPNGEYNLRSVPILEGVESLTWRYCGIPCSETDPTRWPNNWIPVDRLPSRVALELQFTDRRRMWPILRLPIFPAQ
jgi:general secretion pathway protein J